mmetsp:Transcript_27294/g.30394  ORF Transcript_27294/g.30394 Transcript_27294/m.30394 type:complete len:350 (-) Transcript_27294:112-1161(-)
MDIKEEEIDYRLLCNSSTTRAMPIDLVLVRHGQSEADLARKRAKHGVQKDWTPRFREKHNSEYRLTELGRRQSQIAGQWIKANITHQFDRFYCSEYARARETAAILDMDNALWITDFLLRERDKGVMEGNSAEKRILYAAERKRRELDAFYWSAPGGGESIANSCLRVEQVLRSLRETCSGFRVVVVCHGNVMLAFRILLESISSWQFKEIVADPQQKIHHGQILHYSRRNPVTGDINPYLNWMRSTCPWDSTKSSNQWHKISQLALTDKKLLQSIEHIPIMVNNTEEELAEWNKHLETVQQKKENNKEENGINQQQKEKDLKGNDNDKEEKSELGDGDKDKETTPKES